MSEMEETLQAALNSLHPQGSAERMKANTEETALYKFCKMVYGEIQSWSDHGDVYSDEMKALHAAVLDDLQMKIEDRGHTVNISYTLEKRHLSA